MVELRGRAEGLLRRMFGGGAAFREGQWEAIRELVESYSRVLLVQKTGWGKSIVYFIAAKLLRESGAGPALLISPLLSLMRNQIGMAERIGIDALTVNSANTEEWDEVEENLRQDKCDVLLVSPERLSNRRFIEETLPLIYQRKGVGLFVVDEAHCISDWGHDFRPDYRRIERILRGLPRTVPVLATTATANNRVVADVAQQLGPGITVLRGPLARASLRLQTIRLADQSERFAWLAQHLPKMPGSGIIYCLTIDDCERVSAWLLANGIDAPAYHARLTSDERVDLEGRLLCNEAKALVATVALGMGFDKPDLGFVVHYQRPGSVVAYYQQIGRAGRAVENAYAILLNGREDDEIQNYFIRTAFPDVVQMSRVIDALEADDAPDGLTVNQLESRVNLPQKRMEQCLKFLELDGAVLREKRVYHRTVNPWTPDEERSRGITQLRCRELDRMREFVDSTTCLMEFIALELDDPHARPCGKCSCCAGEIISSSVDPERVQEATLFLKRSSHRIRPRQKWPPGVFPDRSGFIPKEIRNAEGRALCIYGDAGWGRAVAVGKYRDGCFSSHLVRAAAELIRKRWRPEPAPTWVTVVPSLRHPDLVPDFASRLAAQLGIPFCRAIEKVHETAEQKTMENSAQQAANIAEAFAAVSAEIRPSPVLLVDDMMDSGWTFTICGTLLREAGSGLVYPFALASLAGKGAAGWDPTC
ncbi:MAG: RecQ family ATP-dependent DNA helicase [bacterium]